MQQDQSLLKSKLDNRKDKLAVLKRELGELSNQSTKLMIELSKSNTQLTELENEA